MVMKKFRGRLANGKESPELLWIKTSPEVACSEVHHFAIELLYSTKYTRRPSGRKFFCESLLAPEPVKPSRCIVSDRLLVRPSLEEMQGRIPSMTEAQLTKVPKVQPAGALSVVAAPTMNVLGTTTPPVSGTV